MKKKYARINKLAAAVMFLPLLGTSQILSPDDNVPGVYGKVHH